MDRLEEIKKRVAPDYPDLRIDDVDWLIDEVERLRAAVRVDRAVIQRLSYVAIDQWAAITDNARAKLAQVERRE